MKTASIDPLLTCHQVTKSSAHVARSVLTEARCTGLPLPLDVALYAQVMMALAESNELLQSLAEGRAFYHTSPNSGET